MKYKVGDMFEVLENLSPYLIKGERFSIVKTYENMECYHRHQLSIGGSIEWPNDRVTVKDDSLLLKVQNEKYYVFLHVSLNKTSFKEVTIKKDDFDMMLKINPSILTLEEKADSVKEEDVFFVNENFSLSGYLLPENTKIKIVSIKTAERRGAAILRHFQEAETCIVYIESETLTFLLLVPIKDLKFYINQGNLVRKIT